MSGLSLGGSEALISSVNCAVQSLQLHSKAGRASSQVSSIPHCFLKQPQKKMCPASQGHEVSRPETVKGSNALPPGSGRGQPESLAEA